MSIESKGRASTPMVSLAGAEKVTALLLSMGKPLADRIIRNFDDAEIRILARAASRLPALAANDIERIVDELEQSLSIADPLVGSTEGAQALLSGVVSAETQSDIMSEIDGTAPDRVWGKLRNVDDGKLALVVSREQPQVAAFILSRLPAAQASAVLDKIDIALSTDLSRRLLALQPIATSAQHMIAQRLAHELLRVESAAEGSAGADRHAQLGSILNQLERPQIDKILDGLALTAPDDAKRVKEHIFGFEDVAAMPAADRVRLFEEVPSERVIAALRDCDARLRDMVLGALAPRARRMVEAELAAPANVSQRTVVEAKRAIAGLALDMAARGIVRLRGEA